MQWYRDVEPDNTGRIAVLHNNAMMCVFIGQTPGYKLLDFQFGVKYRSQDRICPRFSSCCNGILASFYFCYKCHDAEVVFLTPIAAIQRDVGYDVIQRHEVHDRKGRIGRVTEVTEDRDRIIPGMTVYGTWDHTTSLVASETG